MYLCLWCLFIYKCIRTNVRKYVALVLIVYIHTYRYTYPLIVGLRFVEITIIYIDIFSKEMSHKNAESYFSGLPSLCLCMYTCIIC